MSDIVRSQYRIPNDLNEWLIARAKEEARSKNAQLVVELRVRMNAAVVEAVRPIEMAPARQVTKTTDE
jgi:hypothetical protein